MKEFVGKTCPFCKTAFGEGDDVVACSACEMPHHKDCWVENQGCTTFGCMGTIQGLNQPFYPQTPQAFSVICGRCGNQNSSQNRFCLRCGNPISPVSQSANIPFTPFGSNTVRCPKCSMMCSEKDKFCLKCGNPITPAFRVENIPLAPVAQSANVPFTPIGSNTVRCSKCGMMCGEKDKFCLKCGNPIASAVPNVNVPLAPVAQSANVPFTPFGSNTVRCPKCSMICGENDKFCLKCGNPMTPVAPNANAPAAPVVDKSNDPFGSNTKRCSKCSTICGENDKFCLKCGNSLPLNVQNYPY